LALRRFGGKQHHTLSGEARYILNNENRGHSVTDAAPLSIVNIR
jgi:hypothetical protein